MKTTKSDEYSNDEEKREEKAAKCVEQNNCK